MIFSRFITKIDIHLLWWRIFKPQDYDRYFARFGDLPVEEKLEQWANKILEDMPEEILKNEQKFFNKVWLSHRDDEIEI